MAWRPGTGDEVVVHRDRLNGIFTADLAKDYRNMLLLWDTVDIMTVRADPGRLAARTLERLAATFKPERAGLFRWAEDAARQELAAGHGGRAAGSPDAELVLGAAEQALLERARAEGEPIVARLPPTAAGGEPDAAYALPLFSRGEFLGCLFLAGPVDVLALDASDLIFLKALAGQLAAALDRAELAALERRLKEQESRRLKAELEELRHAAEETELVYRSPQMEAVLDDVRRAAPTDATVLVTGASGSGKELVARMVHALSPRRSKPPVVVDCGAVSASLIDSELFGHEKGAYTGAAERTLGRLAEAEGSTLILDEIGELPLEVQAKLLRFVQEKQIVPVGAARPRPVDVRLVAVTNRDLAADVAAGRFREDLYYRLKVVHVEVPTLAERPDDVPLLVDHFVARFAARYRKNVRGLDPEAAELAARYRWPGNVRELENRLLQAVIFAEGREITARELGIAVEDAPPPAPSAAERAAAARRRRAREKAGEAGVDTMELNVDQLEKRHIERLLASEDGSVERVAKKLGIARSTLYQKMKRHGVRAPRRPRR